MHTKTFIHIHLIFSLFFLITLTTAVPNSAKASKQLVINATARELEKLDKTEWLWENDFTSNTGLISTRLLGNDDPSGGKSCIVADDFVIPAGEVWKVDTIRTYLYWYGKAADFYQINIWPDKSGVPDNNNLLYDLGFLFTLPDSLTLYVIDLDVKSLNIGLSEGVYWFSVMGVYDSASMADTVFTFCNRKDTLIGPNPCVVMDSIGAYYVPYPTPWLGIYFDGENPYNSIRFSLYGDKVSEIPSVPALVSPVNSAANITTSPTMIWNHAKFAATYTLEVSEVSDFSSLVVNQSNISGTFYPVSGLATNTLHYWRVSATNMIGTSNWSAVWSFTTIMAVPAVPTLQSPANGATGIAVNPNLTWVASPDADSYILQVSMDQNFTTTVINQSGITATSFPVSGLSNNTPYYWRVSATNAVGTSNWSAVWNFTTVQTAPAAPVLTSPANGATGIAVNPTLTWNPATGADSYWLQAATDQNFSVIVISQSNITGTSSQISGILNNTKYYWRVSATNAFGTSSWSEVWNFTTIEAAPLAPTLSSPTDGATKIPVDATMVWNASAGATAYTLQVSLTPAFSTFVINQSGIATTSHNVTGLSNNTPYYWRVNAVNAGGTSGWSSTWGFTTIMAVPLAPTLSSPTDGETGVSIDPTLIWNATTGAATYALQVSLTPAFTSFIVNQHGIADTQFKVTGLSNNTPYYWRVNGTNEAGTSEWSVTWGFTVTTTGIVDQNINTQKMFTFSVYPPIVNEEDSEVKFYCSTRSRKSAVLIIIDPLGNTILKERFELSPSRSQYQFGSWNLKNRSGRKVGNGEYLAVLRIRDAGDGKIEVFKTLFGVKKGF